MTTLRPYAQRIRELREEAGLTQEDVSNALGVPDRQVGATPADAQRLRIRRRVRCRIAADVDDGGQDGDAVGEAPGKRGEVIVARRHPGRMATHPLDVRRLLSQKDGVVEIEDHTRVLRQQSFFEDQIYAEQIAVHEHGVESGGGADVTRATQALDRSRSTIAQLSQPGIVQLAPGPGWAVWTQRDAPSGLSQMRNELHHSQPAGRIEGAVGASHQSAHGIDVCERRSATGRVIYHSLPIAAGFFYKLVG